jgi:hypothetical protein
VIFPGFVGDLVLGPIAALMLGGAGASTFDVQTAFDARGFWGPFASSVAAGLASAHMLRSATETALDHLEAALDGEFNAVLHEWIEESVA